jgi:hypothetical protein
MDTKTFAVIGGDKRNIVLSKMLSRQGHAVRVFGFAAVILRTKLLSRLE